MITRNCRFGPDVFVVDADSHVNEPHDLWERYLEKRYRDRAIRIRPGKDGVDRMEIDGRPSRFIDGHFLGRGRSMGLSFEERAERGCSPYQETIPYGGCDAEQRIALLDRDGVDATILYPTVALN